MLVKTAVIRLFFSWGIPKIGFLIFTFGIFITEKAIFSVENYQKDIDKISRLVNGLFKIRISGDFYQKKRPAAAILVISELPARPVGPPASVGTAIP